MLFLQQLQHSMKSIRMRNFSGPYFPAFGENTEIYSVNLRIHSECGAIRTRKTPNTDTFHAMQFCMSHIVFGSSHPYYYVGIWWHMELLNISSQLMLLVVPLIPSTFLLAMELVISALFDIKLAMITCFFFIVKEKMSFGYLLQILIPLVYLTIQ